TEVRWAVPGVLSTLLAYSERLQTDAIDAAPALLALIKHADTPEWCRAAALRVVAQLSSSIEAHRKAFYDAGVVGVVVPVFTTAAAVSAAATPQPAPVRVAACQALGALSRSVRHLKTTMFAGIKSAAPANGANGADSAAAALVTALLAVADADPVLEARVAASAALCNLVLSFSALRQHVLDRDGLVVLSRL